jgi:adenylosuccinate lyase
MDALGTRGNELLECFSARLGLAAPRTAWHAARDRQAELLSVMAILAGGLGKIGNEICQLSKSEIGELEEPFHLGKIGSSTMPHKRNPELSEQVVVLARLIKSNSMLGYDALINEHERDYRAVRLEWLSITDSSLYLCGALGIIKFILENLIVHEEAMAKNCQTVAELISTEALMFLLGEKIGKQRAHQLLYTVSMSIHDTGRSLIDQLLEQPEVKGVFSREMLEKAVAPASNIGLARSLTDTVIQAADEWLLRQQAVAPEIPLCPLENESGRCLVPCS